MAIDPNDPAPGTRDIEEVIAAAPPAVDGAPKRRGRPKGPERTPEELRAWAAIRQRETRSRRKGHAQDVDFLLTCLYRSIVKEAPHLLLHLPYPQQELMMERLEAREALNATWSIKSDNPLDLEPLRQAMEEVAKRDGVSK